MESTNGGSFVEEKGSKTDVSFQMRKGKKVILPQFLLMKLAEFQSVKNGHGMEGFGQRHEAFKSLQEVTLLVKFVP